jgi:hypothetical protein
MIDEAFEVATTHDLINANEQIAMAAIEQRRILSKI